MPQYDAFDHDDALSAMRDAESFGVDLSKIDPEIIALNRVCASFLCKEPETLSRAAFQQALARVRSAIDEAMKADPQRAAAIIESRRAQYLASLSSEQRARRDREAQEAAARKKGWLIRQTEATFVGKARSLVSAEYAKLAEKVRPIWEAIPEHIRPKFAAAVGVSITANDINAAVQSLVQTRMAGDPAAQGVTEPHEDPSPPHDCP